jgi:diphosphomevalonate decarboxylase
MNHLRQKVWRASAPSNIALIKYMGKIDQEGNRPTNTSLSYTLSHFRSVVELELMSADAITDAITDSQTDEASSDHWEALLSFEGRSLVPLELAGKGRDRFLKHLGRIKEMYRDQHCFTVRSANDFPSDCGLASSASSFAALTRVASEALSELHYRELPQIENAADLSRQGSGSSCRSFFTPWSIWDESGARTVPELAHVTFKHQVIVVDEAKKAVSSSEAHRRVVSSALFTGRPERAEVRVKDLLKALEANDLASAFEITWAEFWDMHALFETSRPSFGYINEGSLAALRFVRGEAWDKCGRGPLITMDAGPNVHLLYAVDALNNEFMRSFASEVSRHFSTRFRVLSEEWS